LLGKDEVQTMARRQIGLFLIFLLLPLGAAAQETKTCGETASDVVIMLDRTSSVSAENRQKEAEAAQKLAALLLEKPENRVAVGRFGAGDCQSGYQNYLSGKDWVDAEILNKLSNDSALLNQMISQNMGEYSCGGTDLHDAIEVAAAELNYGKNPNHVLILISDGDPNQPVDEATARSLALAAAEQVKENNIRIFTIAFDAAAVEDVENRRRLAAMASHDSTDGSEGEVDPTEQETENTDGDDFFIAPTGDNLEKVFRHIGEAILCPEDKKPPEKIFQTDEKPMPAEGTPTEESPPPNPTLYLQGSGCSLSGNPKSHQTGWTLLPLLLFSLPGLAWQRLRSTPAVKVG
jgi:von Willebrand factor type A domain-containing protein